jgi:hypothetical protein
MKFFPKRYCIRPKNNEEVMQAVQDEKCVRIKLKSQVPLMTKSAKKRCCSIVFIIMVINFFHSKLNGQPPNDPRDEIALTHNDQIPCEKVIPKITYNGVNANVVNLDCPNNT